MSHGYLQQTTDPDEPCQYFEMTNGVSVQCSGDKNSQIHRLVIDEEATEFEPQPPPKNKPEKHKDKVVELNPKGLGSKHGDK